MVKVPTAYNFSGLFEETLVGRPVGILLVTTAPLIPLTAELYEVLQQCGG